MHNFLPPSTGISEWIEALNRSFPDWHIYISDRLTDEEFGAGRVLDSIASRENVYHESGLHLSVSMRSFRAENVSKLVKQVLDVDAEGEVRLCLTISSPLVDCSEPESTAEAIAIGRHWLCLDPVAQQSLDSRLFAAAIQWRRLLWPRMFLKISGK